MKARMMALLGTAAISAVLSHGTAAAQTAPATASAPDETAAASGQLADIVVTARKTSENNQRAPASIVAVNGAELTTRGVTDVQSITKVLPSANLRTQGSIVQVFIRGIGTRTDLPNFAAASAFLFNGIIMPRSGTFGLIADLDRIESIAGPQGTLYGGSAAGGAVNTFSAQPKNDFSGAAQAEYGNYNTVRVSGFQNVALGESLSLRATVAYNRHDSYFGRDLDTGNTYSGRLSLLYKPSADLSMHLFYNHVLDNGNPNNSLIAIPFTNPADPYFIAATGSAGNPIVGSATHQRNRSDIIGANINFNIGENAFTYIPAYVDFKSDVVKFSGTSGRQLQVFDNERQHSQELRWNRTVGALKLSAGLFYLHDRIDFNDGQIVFSSPTVSARTQANLTAQTNESYAAYGQIVWTVLDGLRLTGGARLSHDRIDATGQGAAFVPIDFHYAHSHPDYKAGVDFDITPRVLGYANFQTGYIPFGYNPDVTPTPIVPESRLTAYSGGIKSRLFDNKLELNVEGFYYIYKNFQAIQFVNATSRSTVLNAPKASILGIDIGLRAQITPTTHLDGGVLVERARYDDFSDVGYNYTGNKLINAPAFKLQGGLEQILHIGAAGDLIGRADMIHVSSYYGNFNNFPNARQPTYTKVDLQLSYKPNSDRFRIDAFIRNVGNIATYTTLSPGATTATAGSSSLEAPRTYGVRLSVNWR
jgi:iron complex outermembrane receptor protein